jgi:hypothetical protein
MLRIINMVIIFIVRLYSNEVHDNNPANVTINPTPTEELITSQNVVETMIPNPTTHPTSTDVPTAAATVNAKVYHPNWDGILADGIICYSC